MKGNKLCLCFLLAAGVGLGAHAQNKIAAPMKDVNQVVEDRKSTRLNSSHRSLSRMPSSA